MHTAARDDHWTMRGRRNASTLIVVSEPVRAPSGDEAVMVGDGADESAGERAGRNGSAADAAEGGRAGFARMLRSVLTGPHLHSFRLLLATRLTGQFADGAFQVALASYVIFSPEKQATAGEVAQAFATLLLPFTLV